MLILSNLIDLWVEGNHQLNHFDARVYFVRKILNIKMLALNNCDGNFVICSKCTYFNILHSGSYHKHNPLLKIKASSQIGIKYSISRCTIYVKHTCIYSKLIVIPTGYDYGVELKTTSLFSTGVEFSFSQNMHRIQHFRVTSKFCN